MRIEKERVLQTFADYTNKYDATDEKIRLKIAHTYRVAGFCARIAGSLSLTKEEIDLAWLMGMLHDIGRFEQLKRFGTFVDAQSIDHAHFGVELLYQHGGEFLKKFVEISPEEDEFTMIQKAIWNHSAFRIEDGLEKKTEMFSHILRDADKVDIFRVCQETPLEVIFNLKTEDIKSAEITPEVMEQFYEKCTILRSTKRTPMDHVVGYAALAFELVYPESRKIAKEQGYLKNILEYASENPQTVRQLRELKEFLFESFKQNDGKD